MTTIVASVIIQKLCLWYRVALRLSALLAVRSDAWSRSLPGLAFAWLSDAAGAITMSILGKGSAGSARLLLLLGVNVVQAVHATLVVLASDVEVEAQSCNG